LYIWLNIFCTKRRLLQSEIPKKPRKKASEIFCIFELFLLAKKEDVSDVHFGIFFILKK